MYLDRQTACLMLHGWLCCLW
uniref:Uncharacterized protein n=1 Tax=Anguilla anguilla TaxID=7936 RepID=A0A0E9UI19_ANGAN